MKHLLILPLFLSCAFAADVDPRITSKDLNAAINQDFYTSELATRRITRDMPDIKDWNKKFFKDGLRVSREGMLPFPAAIAQIPETGVQDLSSMMRSADIIFQNMIPKSSERINPSPELSITVSREFSKWGFPLSVMVKEKLKDFPKLRDGLVSEISFEHDEVGFKPKLMEQKVGLQRANKPWLEVGWHKYLPQEKNRHLGFFISKEQGSKFLMTASVYSHFLPVKFQEYRIARIIAPHLARLATALASRQLP